MADFGGDRDSLWVDGGFTARVRGPEPGRVVRIRRPFALIGRHPGADIRIDDPAVDARHAFLLLDRRGIFGVDLRSRAGTRFDGVEAASSRLGEGGLLEVAGRRIELLRPRADGVAVDPPIGDDDLLAEAGPSALAALTLEPDDLPGAPWMLGSALAFAGRGEACAIRVGGASASGIHCALLRTPSAAFVIDLLGRSTRLNDRPVVGASALLDGDILTIGRGRFAVRVVAARSRHDGPSRGLARPDDAPGSALALPAVVGSGTPGTQLALLLAEASRPGEGPPDALLEALRPLLVELSAFVEGQAGRMEALGLEVAALREELRARRVPAVEGHDRLRLDPAPRHPSDSAESAAWLLDRIHGLRPEVPAPWWDLLGRVAASARPRTPAGSSP